MERLTEPMIVPSTGEILGYRSKPGVSDTKLKNKLGAYEDAEEQGLLFRLPCKVGDIVYVIDKIIHPFKVEKFELFKYHIEILCEYTGEDEMRKYWKIRCPLADLGKIIFLTKAEAEKALEEMG